MQRFGSQLVNGSQKLLRSVRNHFHTTIPLIWRRTSRKRLVLIRSEVLGQFVNTMTAVYNYFRYNLENLKQQVQTQISLKRKTFSAFFIAYMKSTLNLEYFLKKDQSHSLSIKEFNNCKTSSYLIVKKAIFHATLRQPTCWRVSNTAQICTEPFSYYYSINLR